MIKLVEILSRCSVGSCEENSSYSTDSRLPAWYGGQDIDREARCRTPILSPDCREITGWAGECQYDQLLFDRSLVISSLVEDFNLVCDRHGCIFYHKAKRVYGEN